MLEAGWKSGTPLTPSELMKSGLIVNEVPPATKSEALLEAEQAVVAAQAAFDAGAFDEESYQRLGRVLTDAPVRAQEVARRDELEAAFAEYEATASMPAAG
jgi:hypothetical protein